MKGRMNIRPLFVFCALAALPARDADACSCAAGPPAMITPGPIAPLNAHVRIEVASYASTSSVFELRVHKGAPVATTSKKTSPGLVDATELVPLAPLAPHTRYDVAEIVRDMHPPIVVFGTFETGDAADTTAPRIDRNGVAQAHSLSAVRAGSGFHVLRSTCSAVEPRIEIEGIHASDPGRADAKLAFAIWRAEASGRIDDTRAPAATLLANGDSLVIGRSSICDPHNFALADKGVVVLGVAAVDEAGNKSPTRTLRVDMSAAVP
jgi:hypothetical protein